MKKERHSINIDDDSISWIEEQIKKGEFDSLSSAIRKCISISRRVYDKASPEEIVKFVLAK